MATGLGSYSTTPLTNGSASSQISMVEGMPPSAVNDGIRQIMADVALWLRDAGWIEFKEYTWTYASATSVTVAGVDVTAYFPAGRAVRAVGSSTGTIYGKVRVSSFSTNTTINFEWDSGSLSNETLAISVALLSTTGQPVSSDFARAVNTSKATDVTASSSMNVWSVLGNSFNMPGTATVSAFSDAPRPGAWRLFRNTAAKTFINSANLILPSGEDFAAQSGDMGLIWAEGTATFVVSFFPREQASSTAPTVQAFTSGSGSYVTPAGATWIEVELIGGGGGGGSSATSGTGNAGGTGGTTDFSTLSGAGGTGGGGSNVSTGGLGGAGGAASGGDVNMPGSAGQSSDGGGSNSNAGGSGASGVWGGGGLAGNGTNAGAAGGTNTGAGGGGGGQNVTGSAGAGGGAGGYVRKIITPPSASYSYSVAVAGAASTAGTGGVVGGAGGAGYIIVREYYD